MCVYGYTHPFTHMHSRIHTPTYMHISSLSRTPPKNKARASTRRCGARTASASAPCSSTPCPSPTKVGLVPAWALFMCAVYGVQWMWTRVCTCITPRIYNSYLCAHQPPHIYYTKNETDGRVTITTRRLPRPMADIVAPASSSSSSSSSTSSNADARYVRVCPCSKRVVARLTHNVPACVSIYSAYCKHACMH